MQMIFLHITIVFILLVSFSPAVWAYDFATADGVLQNYGIAKDEQTLVRYLDQGLPATWSLPEEERGNHGPRRSSARWQLYGHIATALGEMKSERAMDTLSRRIDSLLPRTIDIDLDYAVVKHVGTWADWELNRELELVDFRSQCALALAHIGEPSVLSVVSRFHESLTRKVKTRLEAGQHINSYASSLRRSCWAVSGLGSSEGIEDCMAMLPYVDRSSVEFIVSILRRTTGQPFGPDYDLPSRLYEQEIGKWAAWWANNKDSLVIDLQAALVTENALVREYSNIRGRDLQSVRDCVFAASRRFDPNDFWGNDSAKQWLKKQGESIVEELVGIANNPSENFGAPSLST